MQSTAGAFPWWRSSALGSGAVRVDGIQIRQFDAYGFSGFNFHRDIPSHAHISCIGVKIKRADPIFARSKTRKRRVPLEISVRRGCQKFKLRHVRSDALHAFPAIVLERCPLALRIDAVQFEFYARDGLGTRAKEFPQINHIFFLQLLVLLWLLCFVGFRILWFWQAVGHAAAIRPLVGLQEFRNAEDVIRAQQLVNVRFREVQSVMTLEPRAQFWRNRQAINKLVARRDGVFLLYFLYDLRVAFRQHVKRELSHWLRARPGRRDARREFERSGLALR